ncbi:MAG: hypothetical protein MZU97_01435 [Bacillus subtilis]|nr:hypothetical protein [Bacillus subtilis]
MKVGELSTGMRQKVQIAIALVHDPDVDRLRRTDQRPRRPDRQSRHRLPAGTRDAKERRSSSRRTSSASSNGSATASASSSTARSPKNSTVRRCDGGEAGLEERFFQPRPAGKRGEATMRNIKTIFMKEWDRVITRQAARLVP